LTSPLRRFSSSPARRPCGVWSSSTTCGLSTFDHVAASGTARAGRQGSASPLRHLALRAAARDRWLAPLALADAASHAALLLGALGLRRDARAAHGLNVLAGGLGARRLE